ncbi:MAG: HAD family phosphatase [Flavobacteriales bacterium]
MGKGIDTILLDLGGVLIDVDYERTAQEFAWLGFTDFDRLYSKAKQDHLFDGFETGALSPAQFRDGIRTVLAPLGLPSGEKLDDATIDRCWNAMLGSIPEERLTLVAQLRQRYQLLLLSNTNAIHVPAFTAIVERENGITDFKGCFDGAYYSCDMGLRKPDARAYHHVLAQHGASPERTLFIDDSVQHVVGAREAGLNAEHLDLHKEDFAAIVRRVGL